MKIFKFWATNFSRIYVLAEDMDDLIARSDEIFKKWHRESYDYDYDGDTPLYEDEYQRQKTLFMNNLHQAEMGDVFYDQHY